MLDQLSLLAQTSLGDGASESADWKYGLLNVLLFVGALVIPFLIGQFLSKSLKMPTHSGGFTVIAFFLLVTATILLMPLFNSEAPRLTYGPDIAGGTNLIYEINRTNEDKIGPRITASQFLTPLKNRLNPSGTLEINIRPNGEDNIEITIPAVNDSEIAEIERLVTEAGILQFRIVANRNDHQEIIDLAKVQASSEDQNIRVKKDVKLTDKTTGEARVVGIWRRMAAKETSPGVRTFDGYDSGDTVRNGKTGRLVTPPGEEKPGDLARWFDSQGIDTVDILLALEKKGKPYQIVDGVDLKSAKKDIGRQGNYEVSFTMSTAGANKMLKMTSANLPDPSGDFKRRMAILLDDNVLSAPNLNDSISSNGSITGNFSEKDVQRLVDILNAGALPGVLSKQPISKNVIGPNMGKDAISKSFFASMLSLIVTVVLVVIYYRYCGLIASISLAINLLMILAVMILIRQPLTLAGVAGLVLSVGMSVDANVLVFERIREEREKKATPRLAIRNGFDRAWTTIFDSNLTTLITALVLYWVGTEQIKGFAVALIIGLVISLFTAVYLSHKMFEVAERTNLLWLGMADYVNGAKRAMFGKGDVDFMKYRKTALGISLAVIVLGLVATFFRGSQILDIDFNGGTSIVFSLEKGLPPDEVREISRKIFEVDKDGLPIQSTLTNVKLQDAEENSVYRLDVSLRDQDEVANRLMKGFSEAQARLVTYDLDFKLATATQSSMTAKSGIKLVSFQEASAAAATSQEAAAPDATSKEATASQEATATATPTETPSASSTLNLNFRKSLGADIAKINAKQLRDALSKAAETDGKTLVDAQIELFPKNLTDWTPDSSLTDSDWTVNIPFDGDAAASIGEKLKTQIRTQPVWQSLSKIEASVAGDMQRRAWAGLFLSLIFIVAYIWFRFQKLAFGIAAVVALVHDVLVTLTFIAISHWLFNPLAFLQMEDFKISLTIVAAFLTIIGYSLNDTIVVFDRIREVKGKSPRLTREMINTSVTQTLSRTLLTSSTTIVAILLMYFLGGEAIHGFAYCLFVGIVVGTYSSIFIASPVLLWIAEWEQAAKAKNPRRA
jgi:SecD/SecF fusion protein